MQGGTRAEEWSGLGLDHHFVHSLELGKAVEG